MFTYLYRMKRITNLLFQMSVDLTKLLPQVEEYWAKCWLDQQKNLFKVRQKLIAKVQKNMYDF